MRVVGSISSPGARYPGPEPLIIRGSTTCSMYRAYRISTWPRCLGGKNGNVGGKNGNVEGDNGNVGGDNGNVGGKNGNVGGKNGNVGGKD